MRGSGGWFSRPGRFSRSGWFSRDRVVDVAAVLVALAFVAVSSAFRAQQPLPTDPAWAVPADQVVGVLAALALGLRRRWPLELSIALGLVTAFSETAGGAAAIALLTVAIHRPVRRSVPAAALNASTALVFVLLRPDPDTPLAVGIGFPVVLTLALLGWGLAIRQRRELLDSLRERAERAEADARTRAERAQALAREQIAREMHDVLGHRLSLLSVQAGALEYRPDASPGEVAGAAGVIRASAHQALEDLRAVLVVLRAESSALPAPTLRDLDELIAESHRSGMRVALRTGLRTDQVPDRLGLTAYRIVQEGLTNARRHAPGVEVALHLSGRPGAGLDIELRNPLPGGPADPDAPAGFGLIGLAERAGLVGGYLSAQAVPARPGAGAAGPGAGAAGPGAAGEWRLWAWLPWSS